MTTTQLIILNHLLKYGGDYASNIAGIAGLNKHTVLSQLNRFERAGLVISVKKPEVRTFTLTEAGKEAIKNIQKKIK